MKDFSRKLICGLLLTISLVSTTVSQEIAVIHEQKQTEGMSQVRAVNVPPPCAEPENGVALDEVTKVANLKAKAEWGEKATLGTIIPVCDFDGKAAAYLFDFRLDGEAFPSYVDVANSNLKDRTRLKEMLLSPKQSRTRASVEEEKVEQSEGERETIYGTVILSATYDRTPILGYGKGASFFYSRGWRALNGVRQLLGKKRIFLSRIYYLFPSGVWFEFKKGKRSVVVEGHVVSKGEAKEQFLRRIKELQKNEHDRLGEELKKKG